MCGDERSAERNSSGQDAHESEMRRSLSREQDGELQVGRIEVDRFHESPALIEYIHRYRCSIESSGSTECVNGLVVGKVIDALGGVLASDLELNTFSIMAPAVGNTNDAGHHLV